MSASLDDLEPFEVFQQELDEYLKEYEDYLSSELKPATIRKHATVINGFIEFVCFENSISGLDQIIPSMIGSKFRVWFNRVDHESYQTVTVRNILKGYFEYIYNTHGIRNKKLMKYFER